jgi:hypothetical protein
MPERGNGGILMVSSVGSAMSNVGQVDRTVTGVHCPGCPTPRVRQAVMTLPAFPTRRRQPDGIPHAGRWVDGGPDR